MSRFRVTLSPDHTYEVAFKHHRPQKGFVDMVWPPTNDADRRLTHPAHIVNGATECFFIPVPVGEICNPDASRRPASEATTIGLTICALQDNFSRKTGRKIAFSRAVDIAFPKIDITQSVEDCNQAIKNLKARRLFWAAFLSWERANQERGEQEAFVHHLEKAATHGE